MRLRPINTIGDATIGGQTVGFQGPAPVKALVLAYKIDNAAGTDADFDNITGSLHVKIFGDIGPKGDICALHRPQSLTTVVDAIGGRCRLVSTTGDYAYLTVYIPLGGRYDDNVRFVREPQRMIIYVPEATGAEVDGAECTVYAVVEESGVNRYNLIHLDEQVTLGGLRRLNLTKDGLIGLVLSVGSTTNPDSFALLDGSDRLVWGDWDDYHGVWQSAMEIEGDPIYADQYIDLTSQSRYLWQGIHRDLVLELQGGTGTLTVHQLIQDQHIGGALQDSLRYRAERQQATIYQLRNSNAPAEVEHALVPQPSLNPSVMPIGGQSPSPSQETLLPVEPQQEQARVPDSAKPQRFPRPTSILKRLV